MEDVATAEISRAQVWEWIRHQEVMLDDGRKISFDMVDEMIAEELDKMLEQMGESSFLDGGYPRAAEIFTMLIHKEEFEEFLTIPAYKELIKGGLIND